MQLKEELIEYGYIRRKGPTGKKQKITSHPFHYRSSGKVFCILNLVLYFLKIADVRLRHHGVIGVINNEARFASVWFAQVFL